MASVVRQRAKRWYQSIKPIIQQKVCVILGHVSEISYEEHLTPFYGASIAELQFTDSDIYYSEPAMLMYYNDALSLATQVLAPLRALLEIVLANHEPTDEVEGIYLPLLGTEVMTTLSMAPWLVISTTPLTPSIWIYQSYDRASYRSSHQFTESVEVEVAAEKGEE